MSSADSVELDRAQMLVRLGRAADAEREAREAVARRPEDPRAHLVLTYVLSDLGDVEGALEAANRTVALRPEAWFGHWAAGLTLYNARRHREALTAFRNALECDPEVPAIYERLARTHHALGESQHAAQAAAEGLRLNPDHVGLIDVMGKSLLALGDQAGARAQAERALALEPEAGGAHVLYGRVAWAAGDHRGAARAFREALRLKPDWSGGPVTVLEMERRRNPLRRLHRRLWRLRSLSRGDIGWFLAGSIFAPWLLVVALVTLAIWVSWIGQATTSLRLSRDRFYRSLLDPAEVRAARFVAAASGVGLALLVLSVALRTPGIAFGCVALLTLVTPIQETTTLKGPRRRFMAGLTIVFTALFALSIPWTFTAEPSEWGVTVIILTSTASWASTWLALLLHPRERSRKK